MKCAIGEKSVTFLIFKNSCALLRVTGELFLWIDQFLSFIKLSMVSKFNRFFLIFLTITFDKINNISCHQQSQQMFHNYKIQKRYIELIFDEKWLVENVCRFLVSILLLALCSSLIYFPSTNIFYLSVLS